ncbi:hypothetical protein M011DRAFT_482592 [Sporormia fimetaria CBS 119925]|uniref:F-box domain-containing protein n=1 Tax=Sporormia fimetaria CBS 119925 TaxID=1340428 RepID=A0A6A6VPI9_9PLEO|nr:hypothetical protein M011DRAFT_482592 [Sporormia fimetaria CBS 119925]
MLGAQLSTLEVLQWQYGTEELTADELRALLKQCPRLKSLSIPVSSMGDCIEDNFLTNTFRKKIHMIGNAASPAPELCTLMIVAGVRDTRKLKSLQQTSLFQEIARTTCIGLQNYGNNIKKLALLFRDQSGGYAELHLFHLDKYGVFTRVTRLSAAERELWHNWAAVF